MRDVNRFQNVVLGSNVTGGLVHNESEPHVIAVRFGDEEFVQMPFCDDPDVPWGEHEAQFARALFSAGRYMRNARHTDAREVVVLTSKTNLLVFHWNHQRGVVFPTPDEIYANRKLCLPT
jgi:hypothetical protein